MVEHYAKSFQATKINPANTSTEQTTLEESHFGVQSLLKSTAWKMTISSPESVPKTVAIFGS